MSGRPCPVCLRRQAGDACFRRSISSEEMDRAAGLQTILCNAGGYKHVSVTACTTFTRQTAYSENFLRISFCFFKKLCVALQSDDISSEEKDYSGPHFIRFPCIRPHTSPDSVISNQIAYFRLLRSIIHTRNKPSAAVFQGG